jgi:alpha-galactosidase
MHKTIPQRAARVLAVSVIVLLAVVAVGALTQASQAGPTSVTGVWVLRVPNTYRDTATGNQLPDGNFRETFFDLKQDGATVTGEQIAGKRRLPISEGTYTDGKLHFVIVTRGGNPPQERRVTYDGTAQGNKFEVTSTFPGRNPVTGSLETSTMQAALPPAPLPLPALHDVRDNGLARTPPMGWNSWNKFAGRITDADVRGVADAMVASGMKDAGYVYINIDDTWEGPRDAKGNITTNKKFPDMKALADYVHSKGLKIGIYSGPGPKTCAGYEGSFGHEEQDAKQYAAWGFDYLKYDWCSAGDIYEDKDMQAVYQKMGDALLKAGRPIVYSLCQYGRDEVWKWGAKVGGNLWRTTGDISDRWQSLDRIGFGTAVPGQLHQFDINPSQSVGHVNDPDMLEIGNGGMTGDEYRTHMTLWSMLAAPLLAGNDLRTMTDETKSILMNKEVIAIDQDSDVKPIKQISEPNAMQVVISRQLHDGSTAIALFNRAEQEAPISVNWSSAGLAGKQLKGRDLWKHADVTLSGDSYSSPVPAHGVVLLKVSAAK